MISNVPVTTGAVPSPMARPRPARSYAHAHWYFLLAFLAIVAGFWPTFFGPMGSGTTIKNVHGVTSSLWYFVLMAQSWLMSRGLVRWHRRVAMSAIVLLPVLSITALANTRVMLSASAVIPPEGRPIIAFIDVQIVAQLWVFVALGLLNRRTPPAHKRFMAATALPGLSPALARLYGRLGIGVFGPIHTTLLTANLILLALIVVDWRMGEKRLAYPVLLVWNIAIQLLIIPLSMTSAWLTFCRWFAA